jgi:uncharacterized membrane protein YhaH (DUF805 family)
MAHLFSTEGRITRKKFWMYFLFFSVVLIILNGFLVLNLFAHSGDNSNSLVYALIVVFILLFELLFLLFIAKRFHDRDKSGWWACIVFMPAIGLLWVIIECGFLKGTTGPNKYGPDPLDVSGNVSTSVQSVAG